jgi:hypothetical protein
MIKKIHTVSRVFTALFCIACIVRSVSLCKMSYKVIIFKVYKSIFPKRPFGKNLFKNATDIWFLCKNNLDSLGRLPFMLRAGAGMF